MRIIDLKTLYGETAKLSLPSDLPLYVDAYRPDSTFAACRQIIAHYGPDHLIANITGGTKVMSIAAFRAFSTAGIPCIYTDTANQSLLYLYPDNYDAETLQTKVDVLTYLQAHGQLASLRARDARLSVPELAGFIDQHITRLDPFFGRLRYEVRDASDRSSIRFSVEGRQRHAIAGELVLPAMRAGLVEARKRGDRELEITFTDERSRRYLEGEWLEDLVYDAVQQGNFDHHATNIALGWQDAPEREMNEIDIAVVHHLRCIYISCKTGSDTNQMKQHLFELETLSNMAGGFFNHPILVASSLKAVPGHLRRRMETLGIAYLGPQDLPQLVTRLQELIRGRMLTVIAYDMADDRRREAVSTMLADHGRRVNYSVFECELDRQVFEALLAQLSQIIEARKDRVPFYRLCEDCRTPISRLGRSPNDHDHSGVVII